jgi:hypothetical protein
MPLEEESPGEGLPATKFRTCTDKSQSQSLCRIKAGTFLGRYAIKIYPKTMGCIAGQHAAQGIK